MPNKKLDEYGDYDIIPASEVFAELHKDSEFMREHEKQKPERDRLLREIDRRIARREWRAAQLARVRNVWQSMRRGFAGVAA